MDTESDRERRKKMQERVKDREIKRNTDVDSNAVRKK